jgi:hypothetical protein
MNPWQLLCGIDKAALLCSIFSTILPAPCVYTNIVPLAFCRNGGIANARAAHSAKVFQNNVPQESGALTSLSLPKRKQIESGTSDFELCHFCNLDITNTREGQQGEPVSHMVRKRNDQVCFGVKRNRL